MTDYSHYSSFVKFKNSNDKTNNYKANTKKNTQKIFVKKETIVPGDRVTLLFLNSNEIETYRIVHNYMQYKPKASNNPKGDIRKKEYIAVPTNFVQEDEISNLSELYKLLKYKEKNTIIEFNNQKIKILEIVKGK